MGSLVKEDWSFNSKKQIIDKQFLFFFWKLLKKEPETISTDLKN